MNMDQPCPLPGYYNRTSLGSVLERRCRAAIDAFEGLQIRNALGLLASANAAAIARAAASNVGASVFRFSSPPLHNRQQHSPTKTVLTKTVTMVLRRMHRSLIT